MRSLDLPPCFAPIINSYSGSGQLALYWEKEKRGEERVGGGGLKKKVTVLMTSSIVWFPVHTREPVKESLYRFRDVSPSKSQA